MMQVFLTDHLTLNDQASFESLFRKWYVPLCKTIYRIVQDKQAAEDIAQDAFFVVWEKKDEIHISVKSYLYRVGINRAFGYLEKEKRFVRTPQDEDWYDFAPAGNTTEQVVFHSELEREIHQAIEALPPACRSVFLMSRVDELSYKEIAAALEISVKTVENQMSKALKVLKEKLLVLSILLVLSTGMYEIRYAHYGWKETEKGSAGIEDVSKK